MIKGTFIFQEDIDSTRETSRSSLLPSQDLRCVYFLVLPLNSRVSPFQECCFQFKELSDNSNKSCQASDSQNTNIHSTEETPQVTPHWFLLVKCPFLCYIKQCQKDVISTRKNMPSAVAAHGQLVYTTEAD